MPEVLPPIYGLWRHQWDVGRRWVVFCLIIGPLPDWATVVVALARRELAVKQPFSTACER